MTFEEFLDKYKLTFNDQQKAAILACDRPVCLLACPGSGKTRTLVAKVGYMITCLGVRPENILTMTYTVSAAGDMAERFQSFFGPELASRVQFRTINSIAQGVITAFARSTGKTVYGLVSEEKDRAGYIRQAYLNIVKEWPVESDIKSVGSEITLMKNMLYTDAQIKGHKSETEHFPEIYFEYQRLLAKDSKMDFDDQLTTCYRLLKKVPDLLSMLQERYRYVCLDEAQDTSKVQHEIVRMITEKSRRLFMVGDEDQSIYKFRGAFPEGLLNFKEHYPDGEILLMEKNYRSDANIVNAADLFIQKNTKRHAKHIVPERMAADTIRKMSASTPGRQYDAIVRELKAAERHTAVLARNNESLIPFIDRLERENVPYNVRQMDMGFFTHPVVTDIKNFLTLASGNHDPQALQAVYYKSSLHLKKEMVQEAVRSCERSGSDVFDVLRSLSQHAYQRTAITAFVRSLNAIGKETPSSAISSILYTLEYEDFISRSKTSGQRTKIEILKAIAEGKGSIREFLQSLEDLADRIAVKERTPGAKVILSTVHSSKGLEYDTVFLVDAYKGCFPEKYPSGAGLSGEALDILEEERRLYYVGITRAKNHLTVVSYEDRVCPFTDELFAQRTVQAKLEKAEKTPQGEAFEQYMASIKPDTTVVHNQFGWGTVVTRKGSYATVIFETVGIKQISLMATFMSGAMKTIKTRN